MNTGRVLVGFNNLGEEICLYKRNDLEFINILDKSIYPNENIDFNSLVLATNTLDLRQHMYRGFIKMKYKEDRERMVMTRNYFLGSRIKVVKYKKEYSGDFTIIHNWEPQTQCSQLFECLGRKELNWGDYFYICRNLMGEQFYGFRKSAEPKLIPAIPNFGVGTEFIVLNDKTLEDISNETILEKKEVNEIDYFIKKKSLALKGVVK